MNVEKIGFWQKVLSLSTGSRVGILKLVMPDFGFQEARKLFVLIPKLNINGVYFASTDSMLSLKIL